MKILIFCLMAVSALATLEAYAEEEGAASCSSANTQGQCPSECPNLMISRVVKGYYCVTQFDLEQSRNCTPGYYVPLSGCERPLQAPASATAATTPSQTIWGASCKKSLEGAVGACNMNNNSDIGQAMNVANGIKNQMDNTALSNLQVACNGMGKLSQMVNAGLAGFKTYCSTQQGDCLETCQNDYKAAKDAYQAGQATLGGTTLAWSNPNAYPTQEVVDEIKTDLNNCRSLEQNIAGAQEGLMKYMAMDQAMQQCSLLTGNTFAEQCKKDPNYSPLCNLAGNTDCNNPQVAATNLVCKCRANPGLAECGGGYGGVGAARADYSSTDSGADGKGSLGDFGGPGGGYGGGASDLMAGGENKNPDGSLNRGGAGKANIGESGGTGNRGGGGAAGGGGSALNAKVIGGYGYGGAGGGYTGSAGAAQVGNYGQNRNGIGPNGQRVDLRQFLPGGKMDPSRGLAGISGPDGITGPNSDIWKKINIRYTAKTATLLP